MEMQRQVRFRLWVRILALALFAATAGYSAAQYGALPQRLAVHFGLDGTPNGWQTKAAFFRAILLILTAYNVGFVLGTGLWLRRINPRHLNICWKQYWLATDARCRLVMVKLETMLAMTGILFNGIFAGIVWLVVRANLTPDHALPAPSLVLGLILGATAAYIAWMFWFQHPPADTSRVGRLKPEAH